MYRKLASALLVAGAISSQSAAAVSLGEITMNSALNEPLDAVIKLTNTKDFDASQIIVKLASADEFDKAGIERTFFLSDIKFTVKVDGSGNGYVHLTSDRRVNEPFLDVLLEGRWPTGRMLRSYTVLVDLPVYKDSQPIVMEGSHQGKQEQEKTEVVEQEPKASAVSQSSQTPQRAGSNQIDQNLKEDEYFTQKNDTLWVIAKRHTEGTDLGVNQTMTAIQQHNPHAFINNNVNLLKQGVVLRLPDEQTIREITQQQATQVVAQQNKEWREAQLDNKEREQEVEDVSSSEEQGHLSLTSAGAGIVAGDEESGEVIEGLQEQLRAAQDEVAASQLESQELNSRVSSLNSQIEQLKRLIELKDAELANLQQEMGRTVSDPAFTEESAALEVAIEETEQAVTDADSADSQADQTAVDVEKQAVVPVLKEKTASKTEQKDSKLVAEKPAKDKPKIKADLAVDSDDSLSLWDKVQQNPIYIGLLGLLIALGMGALLLRRRAKDESQVIVENNSFLFDEEEQEEEIVTEELVDQEEVEVESDELLTGDPIEEADVYLQFGRYEQAATILEKAINDEPSNKAVAAKLAETYVNSDNEEACKALYQNLLEQHEQDSAAAVENLLENNEKGVEWLLAFKAAGLGAAALDTATVTSTEDAVVEPSFDTIDYGEPLIASVEQEVDVDLSDDFDLDGSLDFELDLGDLEEVATDEVESNLIDTLDDEEEIELDFSLDAGVEDSTVGLTELVSPADDEFALDLDFDAVNELDTAEEAFTGEDDLDLGDLNLGEALEEEETQEAVDEAELSLDDFDLDFDEFALEEELELESGISALDEQVDTLVLDSDELALPEVEEVSELVAAELEPDSSDDGLGFTDGADEVATKLDLAQAYIDMGDVEGAKDLLDEVLDQGDEMQKQEANELLSQLD